MDGFIMLASKVIVYALEDIYNSFIQTGYTMIRVHRYLENSIGRNYHDDIDDIDLDGDSGNVYVYTLNESTRSTIANLVDLPYIQRDTHRRILDCVYDADKYVRNNIRYKNDDSYPNYTAHTYNKPVYRKERYAGIEYISSMIHGLQWIIDNGDHDIVIGEYISDMLYYYNMYHMDIGHKLPYVDMTAMGDIDIITST